MAHRNVELCRLVQPDWPRQVVVGIGEAGGEVAAGLAVAVSEFAVRSGVERQQLVLSHVRRQQSTLASFDRSIHLKNDDRIRSVRRRWSDGDFNVLVGEATRGKRVLGYIAQKIGTRHRAR